MNAVAWFHDHPYTFVERIPFVDEGKPSIILCADGDGKRFACSEAEWNAALPATAVHRLSTTQEKLDLFLSFFCGRPDVYAKRYQNANTGKFGYTPVCENRWEKDLCDRKKYHCPDCPNRKFLSLTCDTLKAHLIGKDSQCRDVVGIYPILEDDTTWLLCADFDDEGWQEDALAFCSTGRSYGFAPAMERSRSGNGAHVWFFFSEPVSAADARRLGTGLLTETMSKRHALSFQSYDRLFPSQDSIPKGGFGNLIALPFQGQAQKSGNTLFVDENMIPYADQWAFLSALPRISPQQLEDVLRKLCHNGDLGSLMVAEENSKPWERKQRKKLTQNDFPIQTTLVESNLIYIDKDGYSEPALNALKRLAAFPNPDFRYKQAMRFSVYNIPRIIDCSYEDSSYIGLPRGCREALAEMLDSYHVSCLWDDRLNAGRIIDVSFRGTLREDQRPAAQALLSCNTGVLSATTAFGKTVIGAYLIGVRKRNTLILVHSSALLEQWQSSLSQFLEIKEVLPEMPKKRGRRKKRSLIGRLGGGNDTRSGIVDIAIMQSMFDGEDKTVKSLIRDYGMIIVDECHHVAAFTFEKILKEANASCVYGLSATPIRKDGHHPIIFMQCGPVRYLVDAKAQAEKRPFAHYVIPRFTNTRLPDGGSIQDLYHGIEESESRCRLIIEDAVHAIAAGRTPILLTERKDHAEHLATLLTEKVRHVILLIGSDGAKNKREKLSELQNIPAEEDLAVVATGKYIGEGFDSPRLDTLLLAMPISWKGTLTQYAGRLHRIYEGKKEVRIYDYVDVHVPMLERMYHKRLRGYAELGYEVKLGSRADRACTLYEADNYYATFLQDLSNAAKHILISISNLNKKRVLSVLPLLQKKVEDGVSVEICIDDRCAERAADQIASLRNAGTTVSISEMEKHRYAVIDDNIVWYGNMDLLAFSVKESCVIRFKSPDVAGELADLPHFSGEQIAIAEC